MSGYKVICCIVNYDKASKTLRAAKKYGIKGGTMFIGHGTVKNKVLEILGLNDTRKEVLVMGAEAEVADTAIKQLSKDMAFHKPGHGIAFTVSLKQIFGTQGHKDKYQKCDTHMEVSYMYNAIITIVERGMAPDVIEAANQAGARGGTVINARGSGIHETEMLFAMPIEPEKEIVLVIAEEALTEPITTKIKEALNLDAPGTGIMWVAGIDQVYGLVGKE